jgi:hypothetical protein
MSGSNLPIKSREYKMMLNVDRFNPRIDGCNRFIKLVSFLIKEKFGGTITPQSGQLIPVKELVVTKEIHRKVSYLDTPDLTLRQQGFSLRLRDNQLITPTSNPPDKKLQLTLKYRSSDRYLSAAQDISGSSPKLEEDIAPPFMSKFSHSGSIKENEFPPLQTIGQIVEFFPELSLLHIPANTPVEPINGFIAHEVVLEYSIFKFEEQTKIEPSLSFWYFLDDKDELPLVGEFSFAYKLASTSDTELEKSPASTVEKVFRLFNSLQNHPGWFNFNLLNKTAFAVETI